MARLASAHLALQADTFERLVPRPVARDRRAARGRGPVEHYIQVLADKTGSLIAAAAQVGRDLLERARGVRAARRRLRREDRRRLPADRRRDRPRRPTPMRPARFPAPTCAPASRPCRSYLRGSRRPTPRPSHLLDAHRARRRASIAERRRRRRPRPRPIARAPRPCRHRRDSRRGAPLVARGRRRPRAAARRAGQEGAHRVRRDDRRTRIRN